MYPGQPLEGPSGLPNDQIIGLIHGAGVDDVEIDARVRDEDFVPSVTAATSRFTQDPGNVSPAGYGGTPTAFVNGEMYMGAPNDAAQFMAIVRSASE